jgi:hypothetical protein
MVLTHVDLIEKLLQYNRTSFLIVPEYPANLCALFFPALERATKQGMRG